MCSVIFRAAFVIFVLHLISDTPHACHAHSHKGHAAAAINPELNLMERDDSDSAVSAHSPPLVRSRRNADHPGQEADQDEFPDHSGESEPEKLNIYRREQNKTAGIVHNVTEDFDFQDRVVGVPGITASPSNFTSHNQHEEESLHESLQAENLPPLSKEVVQRLFRKYGNGSVMNYEGFEHMLESLGLGNIIIDDHQVSEHHGEGSFYDIHENHDHSGVRAEPTSGTNTRSKKKRQGVMRRHTSRDTGKQQAANNPSTLDSESTSEDTRIQTARERRETTENSLQIEKCLPGVKLYNLYSAADKSKQDTFNNIPPLTVENFLHLCPLLIYQLDEHTCHSNRPQPCQLNETELEIQCQHYHSHHDNDERDSPTGSQHRFHDGHKDDVDADDHFHSDGHGMEFDELSSENSTGLYDNFKTPSADVWGYALLSCFIISAIGLASVAVVPIMHRVIYNHLLQFLVALAIGSLTGDAFLHLLPHSMKPHAHADSSHAVDEHSQHDSHIPGKDSDEHVTDSDKSAVWLGLVALSGVYFFFLMERIMGIITRRRRAQNREKRKKRMPSSRRISEEAESQIGAKLSGHQDMTKSCEEVLMVFHSNKDVKNMAVEAHNEIHENCDPGVKNSWAPGHSHGNASNHHHSHEVPGSVSSVAWMVIMGDGLHNFSDGLAIGAAFSSSLTSGLSTSIAVFCHELPHELGDFAVLLRAGMSVKQALVYNCVSSVLCLVGMIIGIIVGNFSSATVWIFAAIAGMFVYIALVDMLPELTSVTPKDGENPCLHLLLQIAGMLMGAGIMLIIAIYEDKIKIPQLDL